MTFSHIVSAFFTSYLASERGLAANTIASYSDALKLLINFACERFGVEPEKLSLEQLDRDLIVDFFARECDVDKSRITDQTDIIAELRGDSLMFLSLLAKVRKRYGIGVELKTLARHLMKKPANTVGQVIDLTFAIVKHGEDILKVEL